ncbi:MAG: RND family transporter, partial [Pseudomonadota bacterium]|nr:RND family transporter [Pseudomonadota bacterium]
MLLSLVQDERYDNLSITRNQLRAKRRTAGLSIKEKQTLERVENEYNRTKETLNAQRHLEIAQIREILERYSEHGVLYLGGVPMITDDMVTFVRDDLT